MTEPAHPLPRPLRARPAALVAAGGMLLALAGCGSSSSSTTTTTSPPASTSAAPATTPSAPATGHVVDLAAASSGELKYSTKTLTAPAGTVSIVFTNMAPLEHNVTVASGSGTVQGATPTFKGGSKTLTLSLKPGVYKFYCTVPGHRAAGMEGTLVVGGASGSASGASTTSTSSTHSAY